MTNNTQNVIDTRSQICNTCDQCVYEVLPNFNVCKMNDEVSILIVVEHMTCPKGLW